MNEQIPAKSNVPSERSTSIMVSFDQKYEKGLIQMKTKCILRKKVPRSASIEWLYLYLKSPKSYIVGRAPLNSISVVNLANALAATNELNLDDKTITNYFNESDTVGMYRLGEIELSKSRPTLSDVQKQLLFYPPQSFLYLSYPALTILNNLCEFDSE